MADFFSRKQGSKESRVGLYTTLIVHLSILAVLLISSIGAVVSKESSFVLDFTKQEKIEKEKKQEDIKAKAARELEEMIAAAPEYKVRNIVVDEGEKLKDNTGKPSTVYQEARDLQKRLDASRRKAMSENAEDKVDMGGSEENEGDNAPAYSGPSVVSYRLDGRKATHLPVPAYKGMGSGDVSVKIYVNQRGRVIDAKVNEGASTSDQVLWKLAMEAARRSRFTMSDTAPEPQIGEIVYRFIGQ
ncbi:MAG: hypothetical protein HUJ91_02500 [Bacteroidales bacterium]|nr:hypothetical protein [Bacteroidales bacterium]